MKKLSNTEAELKKDVADVHLSVTVYVKYPVTKLGVYFIAVIVTSEISSRVTKLPEDTT